MDGDRTPRRIQSVDRAFDVLEILRDREGATVTAVAEALGVSPGTAHTYLSTMVDRGYVRAAEEEYRLGLFALPLGESVRSQSRLYGAGRPALDDLAAETGEAAHLVTERNGCEVPLYEEFGDDAVGERFYEKNKNAPKRNLHCSAAGKAILAHLEEGRRDELLADYEFAARTPATITDEPALREELRSVRERGVAFNDEEQVQGLRAVGAPIVLDGTVEGAVSLSAPASRLRGDRFESTIPDRVRQAANVVEVNLQTE